MLAEHPNDRRRFAAIGKSDLDDEVRSELLSFDGVQDYPLLLSLTEDEKSRKLGKILREMRGKSPADALSLICRELKTGRFYLAKALGEDDAPLCTAQRDFSPVHPPYPHD